MQASEANPKQVYIFEKAPYLKAILTLALPSILAQLILVIYNMADTFFIGQASTANFYVDNGLQNALVAGVTICMPLYMILSAISNLFGIGASSVMSRSMGKLDYERARNASRFAFWGCLATSIIYCSLVFIFTTPLASFLSGGNPEVMQFAETYIRITIVFCGVPTTLNTLLSHLFRAEGKSAHAMFGIMIGGLLNIILDPLFMFVIFPIEKAAMGAALATGISNIVALIYFGICYIVMNKKLVISFKFKRKMFYNGVPKECLIIGLPAFLMTLCENVSYMILDNLMGTVSTDIVITKATLAGVGAAKKINMFAHSTVRGMTQGVLPLIGYNKTSGNRHRMRRIVYISGGISVGIASICLIINLFLAPQLSSIFLHETESLKYSAAFLKVFSIGAPFSAIAYTIISFFQAVGKAWRSLILALLRKGILDIPLMYILNNFIPIYGIVWATPIADIICAIVAILLFIIYIHNHGHDRHASAKYSNIDASLEANN